MEGLVEIESQTSEESIVQGEGEDIIHERDMAPFSEFIILKRLEEKDLDFYNEELYQDYILHDENEIRRTFGIPLRDMGKKFSLFRDIDFINEYKTCYHKTYLKELLDHKYLVASDFLKIEAPSPEVEFRTNPMELIATIREKKEEERKNGDDIPKFTKPEHINHYLRTGKIRIANDIRRKMKIPKRPRKLDERHIYFIKSELGERKKDHR